MRYQAALRPDRNMIPETGDAAVHILPGSMELGRLPAAHGDRVGRVVRPRDAPARWKGWQAARKASGVQSRVQTKLHGAARL